MAGSTIGSAPSGEKTTPDGTEKIPVSGSQFVQMLNFIGRKLRETGGTTLSMGAVADGEYLTRSGTSIIGGTPSSGGGGFNEGFMTNGKLVPSVASNNLTLALKTLAGTDPTASDIVQIRIDGVVRDITSALSVTKNAATNWCNAGSSELATKEIDYFAYIGYNATDGITIGFSRIPYANIYSDFSATTTNEKYCAISTITNAASGDNYVNVGRFAATLSAGAGYTWTIPTYTGVNLVQSPIYETRVLAWQPVYTAHSLMTYSTVTTSVAEYFVRGRSCSLEFQSIGTIGGTLSHTVYATLPFEARNAATQVAQSAWVVADTNAEVSFAFVSAASPDQLGCRRTASANWVAGASKYVNVKGLYVIA